MHVTGESLEGVSLSVQLGSVLMCSREPGGCTATDGSGSSSRDRNALSASATHASASDRRRTRRWSTRSMIIRCVCDTLRVHYCCTVYCLGSRRSHTRMLARASHAGWASTYIYTAGGTVEHAVEVQYLHVATSQWYQHISPRMRGRTQTVSAHADPQCHSCVVSVGTLTVAQPGPWPGRKLYA